MSLLERLRKGLQSAAKDWLHLIVTLVLVTLQSLDIYRLVGGDGRRLLAATPAALAAAAVLAGVLAFAGLAMWLAFGRGKPQAKAETRPAWARRLYLALTVVLLLDWGYWWSLSPGYNPAAALINLMRSWADFFIHGAPLIGLSLLVLLAIAGWLGFAERDNARAMERDRLNRLGGGEPS